MLPDIVRKFANTVFFFPHEECEESPILSTLQKIIPLSIRKQFRPLRYRCVAISKLLRVRKIVTKYLGPEYAPDYKGIEIDITYHCDLKCFYCNRFCDILPPDVNISIVQIEKFVRESIELKRRWLWIHLSGGEPTLHPHLKEIIDILLDYKHTFSPRTAIQILTNGYSPFTKAIIKQLPAEVEIIDSNKKSRLQNLFVKTTQAPIDLIGSIDVDFSNGCPIPLCCGVGLTPYGYYPCVVAGAIDRIFGFNKGRRNLPPKNDTMIDLLKIFCPYCGFFPCYRPFKIKTEEDVSPSWKKALNNYSTSKPALTLY